MAAEPQCIIHFWLNGKCYGCFWHRKICRSGVVTFLPNCRTGVVFCRKLPRRCPSDTTALAGGVAAEKGDKVCRTGIEKVSVNDNAHYWSLTGR